MKVHKGYKFRLEPTEEQKVKINKTLGCCRFVYNSMLDRRIKAYQRRGESMSYVRHWVCPKCNTSHDRDKNAAENILKKGMDMLATPAAS